jgi:hypothetical protein
MVGVPLVGISEMVTSIVYRYEDVIQVNQARVWMFRCRIDLNDLKR